MSPQTLPTLSLFARLALPLFAARLSAAAGPPALNSHENNPDHSVTFRLYAPAAASVTVGVDYDQDIPMAKGGDGVWTYTTPPLVPALHMYGFKSDGAAMLDPLNPDVDPCLRLLTNEVTVPGPAQMWDVADVPHGVVHRHLYRTAVIQGLEDGAERYYVYTPPGYDPRSGTTYPVLYLLHGWTHVAESWMHCGQANLILDNLAAKGLIVPMIVVMPLNYGDMDFVLGADQWDDPSKVAHNVDTFGTALLKEIIPLVESLYRVSSKRGDRAIAGLSMGGGQSLVIGLENPGVFGWVGGFSSYVGYRDLDAAFPKMSPKTAPELLWVSCATGDGGYPATKRYVAWLKSKGMAPMVVETPGEHNWAVWRDNLVHFAPLLFRPPAPSPQL
jgi:enterochelin esterase family protein